MKLSFWNSIVGLHRNCCSTSGLNLLKIGDGLKQSRVFSISDISAYSKLTLDANPLHFDPEIARNSGFADVPVPGLLVASLFPRIIAAHFPGAVYATQSLKFRLPVYAGDEIICEVKATDIRQMKHKYMVKLTTTCSKNDGVVVIDGDATTILPTLGVKQLDD